MDRPFAAYAGDETYVFVSYAHSDSSAVYPELIWLKECGFNIWYDEGIEAGTEWREELAVAIRKAGLFIYFITPESVQSENCRKEISFAVDRKIPVIAVHLEATDLPDGLSLTLSDRQAILKHEISKPEYQQKLQSRISSYLDQAVVLPKATPVKRSRLKLATIVLTAREKWIVILSGTFVLALSYIAWNSYPTLEDDWESVTPSADASITGQSTVSPSMHAPRRTIAVMPFVNISDDPANVYFSEGLSEELLNMLSLIPELRVTARTSSFAFKGKDVDIPTIGKSLNVANVLEGSVRKMGRRLRITAQLINVENGYHRWSATYDRDSDDIFAIQNEIAGAVVDALRISLLDEAPRARPTDPDAYAAYLHGMYFYQQRSKLGYEKAVQYLQEALRIDPNYGPAWSLLGAAHNNQAVSRHLPYDDAYKLARVAIGRALEIDPNNPFAISARAWLAMSYERDFAAAASLFQRALDLAPGNPDILMNRAVLASSLGHIEEAMAMTRSSLTLNPISTVGYVNLTNQLTHAGRPAEAVEAGRKAIELTPGSPSARVNLAGAYLLAGQPEKAIEEVKKADWTFYELFIKSLAYHILDRSEESNRALAQMTDHYANVRAFRIAGVHARRDDVDKAFEWLDRAVNEGQPTSGIRTDPFLMNLHDDARWNLLLVKLGLSDEQVAAIRF